tara:strand:+ start:8507 stop:9562 length:1056 start_codon:yes stop_codon:yes gene_type:complete
MLLFAKKSFSVSYDNFFLTFFAKQFKHIFCCLIKHILATKNMKKYATFYECKKCDYKCSKKFLWTQHCSTRKHNRQHLATPLECAKEVYKCDVCGKLYKQRSGLWRHKKKCNQDNVCSEEIEDQTVVVNTDNNKKNRKIDTVEKENTELKQLMQMMLSGFDNDAKMKEQMMEQMKEQSKIIQDMIPRIGNNNNNKFNINVFLNEKCRDAINMTEFIESLQIQLEDLYYTKTNGLIEGVSSIFVNGLKQLETFKRPIHCTDMKRETLYIKDNNEWDRENGKERLRSAINDVANKQRKAISTWEKEHPQWTETEKGKEEYIKLVQSVMTDVSNGANENKIIKSIAKETVIDKI